MSAKEYDLEDRTLKFAKECIDLCKLFIRDVINIEFIGQLVRASGSVGANYREANDTITRKDFYHRIGICRREAKESKYWLSLIDLNDGLACEKERKELLQESKELTNIFGAILRKSE